MEFLDYVIEGMESGHTPTFDDFIKEKEMKEWLKENDLPTPPEVEEAQRRLLFGFDKEDSKLVNDFDDKRREHLKERLKGTKFTLKDFQKEDIWKNPIIPLKTS